MVVFCIKNTCISTVSVKLAPDTTGSQKIVKPVGVWDTSKLDKLVPPVVVCDHNGLKSPIVVPVGKFVKLTVTS